MATFAVPGLDVRFHVYGVPIPKGNLSGFAVDRGPCKDCRPGIPCKGRACFGGRRIGVTMSDQGEGELKAWQQRIHYEALSARNAARQRIIARPAALAVTLIFLMPRPASNWVLGGLAADAREWPTTPPDIDKLLRATLDAFSGSLVEDDAQVVVARLALEYQEKKGGWHGVCVHARKLESRDAWVEHELSYHGVWKPPARRQEKLL